MGGSYVSISKAVFMLQLNSVVALDIDAKRLAVINRGGSKVDDPELQLFQSEKPLNLIAASESVAAQQGAYYLVVATPTNYDPDANYFNTPTLKS